MSFIGKIVNLFSNTLSQKELRSDALGGEAFENVAQLAREVAASGTVLLKNDGVLPLGDTPFALFGRTAVDTFYVGYGSGGDVRAPYRISIAKGILNNPSLKADRELAKIYEDWCASHPVDHGYWAHWPWRYPEMPLSEQIVKNARKNSDTAVVVIGRSAGEDRDNKLEKGSFFLHDEERDMLDKVASCFDKIVVLMNIGNIIDFSWIERFGDKLKALLIVWQGGMETGNAVADVLFGSASPDGKLPMSIAKSYEDYPGANDFGNPDANFYVEDIYVGYRYFETFCKDAVLYPFGYGLSYGTFVQKVVSCEEGDDGIKIRVEVTNVGGSPARDTVQVYVGAPQGKLGKPALTLAGFAKSKLLAPSEIDTVEISIPFTVFASYDDEGAVKKSAYVLERGEYGLYLGRSVRDVEKFHTFICEDDLILQELQEASSPQIAFERIKPVYENGSVRLTKAPVPIRTYRLKDRILENLPQKDLPYTGDKGYKLGDVKDGKVAMDDFLKQLTDRELEAISRGDYTMNSKLGVSGNAGALGGVTKSLREKGVKAVITSDGPSGMRLKSICSLLPIGTLLSSTWDTKLVENLYGVIGREMVVRGSDILLGPGMNIHRNPLCGRNFEYFSEDPLLSGKTGASMVRGIQSHGGVACPKHFACNNQETNRIYNDSRLSERALREIYLKGFEICVKEARPLTIMTSYNKINGVWGHYNYDLCTTVLRGEWDYDGLVMTDWWMRKSASPEFPKLKDQAYRVRAQVDVLMPGGERPPFVPRVSDGTLLRSLGKEDGITRGELLRTAENVLNLVMRSLAFRRK